MKRTLTNLSQKLHNGRWLLNPVVHAKLCELVNGYIKNPTTFETSKSEFVPTGETSTDLSDLHGVLHVGGILSKNPSELEEELLGLTDVDNIRFSLDMLAEDPTVKDIIISWASPGGETTGIEELGRRILEIDKNIKPVYSWCENQADSAAFWLFTQARMCAMTPSAQVGGCGVYMLVLDETKRMEREGVSINAIHAGHYKLLGHEFRELTEDEKKILQEDVNKQHLKFKNVVAANRPKISSEDLEGLSYGGEDALEKGFVDSLCDSLDEYVALIDGKKDIYNNMKPTVEKVKVATSSEVTKEATSADVTTTNVTTTPAPVAEKTLTPMQALAEAFQKFMGSYDGTYQAVPGVPGTEKAEEVPTDYTEKAEDHVEPDGDECACTHCNGTGKMKKAAEKAEDEKPVEPDGDEKKEEGKYDGGYEKKAESLPSHEEFMKMCGLSTPKKAQAISDWESVLATTFTGKIFDTKE